MTEMFSLDALPQRLTAYAAQKGWRQQAATLLVEILRRGEITRGEAASITGLKERTSRELLSQLLKAGILGASSEKGPVSLRFPSEAVDVLFPKLFLAT